jgi:hypothetical protein
MHDTIKVLSEKIEEIFKLDKITNNVRPQVQKVNKNELCMHAKPLARTRTASSHTLRLIAKKIHYISNIKTNTNISQKPQRRLQSIYMDISIFIIEIYCMSIFCA